MSLEIDLSNIHSSNFEENTIRLFRYQYKNNEIYGQYCDGVKSNPNDITIIEDIPFLPISFFKTHSVICSKEIPKLYFESSGTSLTQRLSKHYIINIEVYNESIELGFEHFFGNDDYTILGLLPHYLERPHSSLAYMVKHWMKMHNQEDLFFLYNHAELAKTIFERYKEGKKIILIGISFALLDFAEYIVQNSKFKIQNSELTIIETGGMKGKRQEILKSELVARIRDSFPKAEIISEYGMTELFSQAYSNQELEFSCPPWMKVLVSDINDPLASNMQGRGLANIIDLANIHSCSFIQTEDMVDLNPDGSFEILGRLDNSDIRGCSLMYS